MKKLRKKKEEKEEESDKDAYSKVTREPRKKKESPAARSRVAKGPKKQQGGGGQHPPLCGHPLMASHIPVHHGPSHHVLPVPLMVPVSAGTLHVPGGGFLAKTQLHTGRKGDVVGDRHAWC